MIYTVPLSDGAVIDIEHAMPDFTTDFIQKYIAVKSSIGDLLKVAGDNRSVNQRMIAAEKLLEMGLINVGALAYIKEV